MPKRIIRIGAPLLAGNLSHYLHQVTDTAMVGRLGTEQLAAMGIASLFTGICLTFIWPVTTGVQAITSRRYGRQQANTGSARETGMILDNGIVVGLFAAVTAFIFSYSAPFVLELLVGAGPLLEHALEYVGVIRFGTFFLGIEMAIVGFLSGINRTGAIMRATLSGNIVNILLNYLLIFGKFGFPALGIAGAALGTVLTNILLSLYLLLVLARQRVGHEFAAFRFTSASPKLMKQITLVFLPVAIQNIIALTVFLSYEALVNIQGTLYLAATHIAFAMFRINKTIVGGFARGAAILVGNSLGAEKPEEARRIILGCEMIAFVIGAGVLGVILTFPGAIVSLFTRDSRTMAVGIRALRFFAPFYFIEILGYSFEIIFSGNGWGRFVLFSEFSTNLLFILGGTVLLTLLFSYGIRAAWLSFGLYQLFHALILFSGFLSGRWQKVEVD